MAFSYPQRDLDKAARLVSFLGSYWAGQPEASNYVKSVARVERQTEQIRDETIAAAGRTTINTHSTKTWCKLVLSAAELNTRRTAMNHYGDGDEYGGNDGMLASYGIPHGLHLYSFPLPANFAAIPFICDRLTSPTCVLTCGLDFYVDTVKHVIRFRDNPLTNPAFNTGDTTSLWVFRGKFDNDQLFQHFGYVLGISLPASDSYKTLINAIWDGLVLGSSYEALSGLLTAITAAPCVLERLETVTDIFYDVRHLVVATNSHVYRYAKAATAVVSVGDIVAEGQPLADAYEVHEFQRGEPANSLRALSLGPDYLLEGYLSDLVFYNRDVPLVVTTDSNKTKISFELGGHAGDVAQFFADLHERGMASGQTLANLLDERTNPTTEPTAANLPATINPLQFLAKNVLRNNIFVITLRPTSFGANALSLQYAKHLRNILPPHVGLIITTELAVPGEELTIVDNAEASGYTAARPLGHAADDPRPQIIDTVKATKTAAGC